MFGRHRVFHVANCKASGRLLLSVPYSVGIGNMWVGEGTLRAEVCATERLVDNE